MDITALLNTGRQRADLALARVLDQASGPSTYLADAMRYSVMGSGKRLRPVLVYAAGQALGVDDALLDAPAAAVELIHAYSLVHDDLPSMDDDDLRRGRPTCHKAFDEATALLAGDALQTLAFEHLASLNHPAAAQLVACLAKAAGRAGMAGGQAVDLASVGQKIGLERLIEMHAHKTGALIVASLEMPGLLCESSQGKRVQTLRAYGQAIGLAFQIQDDVLDIEGDTAVIGKTQGADLRLNKPTYPALLGLDGARQRARELVDEACHALMPLGDAAAPLNALARFMIERDH
ncbi:polyprenyl synthetase family protein [Zymobacter sp. IVIA_5232.4 C2]|uniref:polyprenyl synthetase family protein n=1 Tax=Zymobacter sp. IVIA_5232.4 C2 TaxID=3394855 RepID=UPI0039C3AB2D